MAALIGYVLVVGSEASFRANGLGFLVGTTWNPVEGAFGAVPAIVGTLLTSSLALLFSVPVALGAAVFISEFSPRRWREPLATVVDLSAAIPSVIYGLWGLIVVVPIMRDYVEPFFVRVTGGRFLFAGLPLGLDVFTASVVLAIMMIPTISAFARASLTAVPRVQREASLSLGATRSEAARLAVLPQARSGIVAGVLFGFGRAVGETIVVLLLIGNRYIIPTSLLSPGATAASWIATALGAAEPAERSALVELGLLLFAISIVVNAVARWAVSRWDAQVRARPKRSGSHALSHSDRLARYAEGSGPLPGGESTSTARPTASAAGAAGQRATEQAARGRRRTRRHRVYLGVFGGTVVALGLAIAPLVAILLTAIARGGRAFVTPSFYVDTPVPPCSPTQCELGGIGPEIQGTLILVGLASVIAIPLGILAGVYLSEYGRRRLGPVTSAVVNSLTGLPSILLGLVLFVVFVAVAPDLAYSAISGTLALAILMLPIVVRATEEALKQVPDGLREAALALGFPRHRVALRVVLGTARTTVIVGVLLAVARVGGETAALLFTAGGSTLFFQGFDRPIGALTLFIFLYATSTYANWLEAAWGAALVLVVIMLGISIVARLSLRHAGGTAEAG